MLSKPKRTLAVVIAVAAVSGVLGVSTAPAGAAVATANTKFCAVLGTDQGAGIDFEGLGPDEAAFAAKLMRKLQKTGVPAKLKKDLKKLAKVYGRIAKGEAAADVLDARGQVAVLPSLTRFGEYVAANCIPTPPTT